MTTGGTASTWYYTDLPSGYDYSNCYIAGVRIKNANTDYYGLTVTSCGIKDNQIGIYISNISWLKNCEVIFYVSKIPE